MPKIDSFVAPIGVKTNPAPAIPKRSIKGQILSLHEVFTSKSNFSLIFMLPLGVKTSPYRSFAPIENSSFARLTPESSSANIYEELYRGTSEGGQA